MVAYHDLCPPPTKHSWCTCNLICSRPVTQSREIDPYLSRIALIFQVSYRVSKHLSPDKDQIILFLPFPQIVIDKLNP